MEAEEHLGVIAHSDEWRPGATCADCRTAYLERLVALRGQVPLANIKRLRAENASGISSRDIEREIVQSAKSEGRELARPSDFASAHWKDTQ